MSALLTDSRPVANARREAVPIAFERPRAVADGHVVQFYERDDALIGSVASFVGTGLRAGEGTVVIATREHGAAPRAT